MRRTPELLTIDNLIRRTMAGRATPELTVVSGPSLPTQPWWSELHSLIITSFRRPDQKAFPPSWTRSKFDPIEGVNSFAEELGPSGQLIVVFHDEHHVASSGIVPFRGVDWINDIDGQPKQENGSTPELQSSPSEPCADWEICCFCVHPAARGRGLGHSLLDALTSLVRKQGGQRLIANYSIGATGNFWPHMGFTLPLGSGSMLKKGFTHTAGVEGLRKDLHFSMSAMVLE